MLRPENTPAETVRLTAAGNDRASVFIKHPIWRGVRIGAGGAVIRRLFRRLTGRRFVNPVLWPGRAVTFDIPGDRFTWARKRNRKGWYAGWSK